MEEGKKKGLCVGVIGSGGLGSNLAYFLASKGHEIVLCDFDVVDAKFLKRFIPFPRGSFDELYIGMYKVNVVKDIISRDFPNATVLTIAKPFEEYFNYFKKCDIIVITTDSIKSRKSIEQIIKDNLKVPYFHVGVNEDSVSIFDTILDDDILGTDTIGRESSYDREPKALDYVMAVTKAYQKILELTRREK